MAVGEYNGKKFNTMVFEKYLDRIPNLSRNELIKNGVYDVKNKYKALYQRSFGLKSVFSAIALQISGAEFLQFARTCLS